MNGAGTGVAPPPPRRSVMASWVPHAALPALPTLPPGISGPALTGGGAHQQVLIAGVGGFEDAALDAVQGLVAEESQLRAGK